MARAMLENFGASLNILVTNNMTTSATNTRIEMPAVILPGVDAIICFGLVFKDLTFY
jgi:hypothetical protein